MQHKRELGNLYVTAVTIFTCARPDNIQCLFYQIGPAPDQMGQPGPATADSVPQKRDSILDASEMNSPFDFEV